MNLEVNTTVQGWDSLVPVKDRGGRAGSFLPFTSSRVVNVATTQARTLTGSNLPLGEQGDYRQGLCAQENDVTVINTDLSIVPNYNPFARRDSISRLPLTASDIIQIPIPKVAKKFPAGIENTAAEASEEDKPKREPGPGKASSG